MIYDVRKRDLVIAAGFGIALALAGVFRRANQNERVWRSIHDNLVREAALLAETAHLLTDGKVPEDVQRAIYGEVIY
jgi:hypothetical protein